MSPRLTAAATASWPLLLGLSIALSVLAAAHDTLPTDTAIMSWAQDLAFPGQALADAVRSVTSTQVLLAAGGALAILLWLSGYRREAVALAVGLIILPLLQSGLKELVDRPRPGEALVDVRGSATSPSFPSGHVMSSMYFYGFLINLAVSLPLVSGARAALAAVAAAVLVLSGPANVWLGVHWPSDVLGGYAWGLLLLLPVVFVCRRHRRHP